MRFAPLTPPSSSSSPPLPPSLHRSLRRAAAIAPDAKSRRTEDRATAFHRHHHHSSSATIGGLGSRFPPPPPPSSPPPPPSPSSLPRSSLPAMESDASMGDDAAAGSQRGAWKGSNVTEMQVALLRRSRKIPADLDFRIPGDEIVPTPRDGERVVFLAHFQRGFGLPVSKNF